MRVDAVTRRPKKTRLALPSADTAVVMYACDMYLRCVPAICPRDILLRYPHVIPHCDTSSVDQVQENVLTTVAEYLVAGVLKPEAGSAMLFTGDVTHAGLPVASGARAVLVASFSRKGRVRAKSESGGSSGSSLEEAEQLTEEGLVRKVYSCGTVHYYMGEKDARLVRAVFPDRTEEHFEGERDQERLVRSVLPNGTEEHFEGEMGAERLVSKTLPDGTVEYFA